MKVCVGSKNPVKINAVRSAFEDYFGDFELSYSEVESGVAAMPMSAEETVAGAKNRALRAQEKFKGYDYAVGAEGGVEKTRFGMMVCNYIVIVDRSGKIGVGGGTEFIIPKYMEDRLARGEELSEIIDELMGVEGTKYSGGAIGALTMGMVGRDETFRIATHFALIPFVNAELFEK